MRHLSTTAAVLIAAALAAALMIYVFAGGSGETVENRPRCSSQQALDQIKRELFRRAGEVRGTNNAAFTNVANYSVLRPASRIFRRLHSGSDKVTCTGSLGLDLPPGVAAVGGRRSLTAQVAYGLAAAPDGSPRLQMLSKADTIVFPLAAISDAGETRQPVAAVAEMNPAPADGSAVPPPATPPRPVEAARPSPPANTSTAARRVAPPKAPSARAAPPPAVRSPAPAPAPTAPAAAARPSFNCRYARTRGEIAVCSDPALASLDRQMAAQFYRARAVASPGARAMLERSRKRFLAYRDSCGSRACVADAYYGRMREISDIMSGRF